MFGIDTPRQWFAVAFVVVACGFAIWRGGRPERIAGGAFLVNWLVYPLSVNTSAWLSPQLASFALDAPLLAILLWLALRSDRWWPMWAVAFQFLGMLMTVIIAADPRVQPLAYMTAAGLWSYLAVIAVVVGAAREARPGVANKDHE
jgi:hypothetical protein